LRHRLRAARTGAGVPAR